MTHISEIIPYNPQENELSKALKGLYCIHKYNNPFKKINYKEFVKKVKHYDNIYDYGWNVTYENGRKHYPKYGKPDNARNWKKYYDYDGAYLVFADYMNNISSENMLRGEKKYRYDDLPKLIKSRTDVADELNNLQVGSVEYERAVRTYNQITDSINELLGIKVDRTETTFKDVTTSENPKFKPEVVEGVRDILSRRRNK